MSAPDWITKLAPLCTRTFHAVLMIVPKCYSCHRIMNWGINRMVVPPLHEKSQIIWRQNCREIRVICVVRYLLSLSPTWYVATHPPQLHILCRSKLNGAAEKKIAAYSCFWPQNQSNSYFDLCQKHEKTSPQNKFSRLVMTGKIRVFIGLPGG